MTDTTKTASELLRYIARDDYATQWQGKRLNGIADEIERLRAATLSEAELNRMREWYNAICDLAPKYIEAGDQDLGAKITAICQQQGGKT